KSVAGQMLIDGVPVSQAWAVGIKRDGARDDMKSLSEQGQIDHRIARNKLRAEHPGLPWRRHLGRNHRDGSLDAAQFKRVSVITVHEPRPPTGDECSFFRELAVRVFE